MKRFIMGLIVVFTLLLTACASNIEPDMLKTKDGDGMEILSIRTDIIFQNRNYKGTKVEDETDPNYELDQLIGYMVHREDYEYYMSLDDGLIYIENDFWYRYEDKLPVYSIKNRPIEEIICARACSLEQLDDPNDIIMSGSLTYYKNIMEE